LQVLWVIQVSWLQWLLVLLGMGLSGAVLVITFWPAVRDDNKKVSGRMCQFIPSFLHAASHPAINPSHSAR
jgi:hypothetical protein